jgi:hypothetical protein
MPIRRAEELCVKTLVVNALGVLDSSVHPQLLSSILYDFRESEGTAVLIMTQLGPRLVVSEPEIPPP